MIILLLADLIAAKSITFARQKSDSVCVRVPCYALATARMPCRHVTGQDVWCGCHWHATHPALNSPSGIPGTQVRTDRDAGRPHCCRLAPVRQDALHHLGYVLPLLTQLNFVVFPIVACQNGQLL